MEGNTIDWQTGYSYKSLNPAQQLNDLKPNYSFEKAAITLQNSKGLVKNLEKVLSFLKSEKEFHLFCSLNGPSESFFVNIVKNPRNLLSELLIDRCRDVCRDIYDYLQLNQDNFELVSAFRQRDGKEQTITLIYCKNWKFSSQSPEMPRHGRDNQKASKGNMKGNMKVNKLKNNVTQVSQEFMMDALQQTLEFMMDQNQASLVFNDLQMHQCMFLKSLTPKNWSSRLGILEPGPKNLMAGIVKVLKARKNWSLSITESKSDGRGFRSLCIGKKPNFSAEALLSPSPLDVRGNNVVNTKAISGKKNPKVGNQSTFNTNAMRFPSHPPHYNSGNYNATHWFRDGAREEQRRPPNMTSSVSVGGNSVMNTNPLSRDMKLKVGMSTPVVCDRAMKMMKSMGWEGGSLGIRGDGITEPIMPNLDQVSRSGLGHDPSTKNVSRRGASVGFVLQVLEKILSLITGGGDEAILTTELKLLKKERAFLMAAVAKLNNRKEHPTEAQSVRRAMYNILEVMRNDMNIRVMLIKISQKCYKVKRGVNLSAIPTFSPGTNIDQYVKLLIASFSPIYQPAPQTVYTAYQFQVLTHILDLVLGDVSEKTINAGTNMTQKQLMYPYSVVSSINKRLPLSKCIGRLGLFYKIVENIKGYILFAEFKYPDKFILKKLTNNEAAACKDMLKKGVKLDTHEPSQVDTVNSDDSNEDDKFDDTNDYYYSDEGNDGTNELMSDYEDYSDDDDDQVKLEGEQAMDVTQTVTKQEHEFDSLPSVSKSCNATITSSDVDRFNEPKPDNVLPMSATTSTENTAKIDMHKANQVGTNVTPASCIMQDKNSKDSSTNAGSSTVSIVSDKSNRQNLPVSIDGKLIKAETNDNRETSGFLIPTSENHIKKLINTPSSPRKSNTRLAVADISMNEDDLTDYNDTDSSDNIDGSFHCKNNIVKDNGDNQPSVSNISQLKSKSVDDWELLPGKDMFNLQQIIGNNLTGIVPKKDAVLPSDLKHIADSKTGNYRKTLKILPLTYPKETMGEQTVFKIQNLIMEAISETQQPLLKFNGVIEGALSYTCFTESSHKFLLNILQNTKTKVIEEDVLERCPRLFMKVLDFPGLSPKDVFDKIELYNKSISTKNWKLLRCWMTNNFAIHILDVDRASFESIKDNGFSLFWGPDKAEFSVVWR